MKTLSIILLFFSLGGFAQDSTEVVLEKNSIYISFGFKTYGAAINYERLMPLLKNKPLYISGSLGLGFGFGYGYGYGYGTESFQDVNVIPTYIGFGYGNKNRVTVFIGLTHLISWEPTLKTKEEREDWKTNPNSDLRIGAKPILPYDNTLNTGLAYKRTFKNDWFFQAEATMLFERWPSYKKHLKWTYSLEIPIPLIEIAFGKNF